MPSPSSDRRVALLTSDLFFRAKLAGVARASGWTVVRGLPAEVAVVELGRDDALGRIAECTAAGVRVIAFGSHVRTEDLRRARELGAASVPNSRVEGALRDALAGSSEA